ncbi:MAG TPA: alpha/beta fold hydrolase [Pyrinomonadaceae bacterium]|jgi:alpha-beta hydrolase superfamily lysophospholipase
MIIVLASAGVLAWAVYKAATGRAFRARLATAGGRQGGAVAAADMSRFTPARPPVRCQPWDIGTGVRGYVWHAPEPRAVLLLQHGLDEYAWRYLTQYNALIPHLLNAGVTVYAFDAWGHGHSPGTRSVFDIGRAVEDHLSARRRLRAQPLPVFLLGHSLGGLVTAASVARDAGGLGGVILSSPALGLDSSAWMRAVVNVAAFLAPTLPAPVPQRDIGGLTRIAERVTSATADPMFSPRRLRMLVAASALATARRTRDLYPDWHVPTLVFHGTADTYTDPEGSREFYEAIVSADKTLHLVEGGYHELLNDTVEDEILQMVLTWLERRIPRA